MRLICSFFNKIDEINKSDFIPTEEDILRARIATTGVVEVQLPIQKHMSLKYVWAYIFCVSNIYLLKKTL